MALDKLLFFDQQVWYFSYLSTKTLKTYIVDIHWIYLDDFICISAKFAFMEKPK